MGAKASRQLEAVFENRDAESEESLTPKDESHDSDALQTANLRRLVEYEEVLLSHCNPKYLASMIGSPCARCDIVCVH